MDLVDEEDGRLVGGGLLDELREALLELAAVHGPGEQHPHLDGTDVPVGDDRGDVAARDELRQTLDDRRLADPGVADEDRVGLVLGHEDLNDLEDLRLASDDRLQLALPRELGEVASELLEHAGRGLGAGLLDGAALAVGVGRPAALRESRAQPRDNSGHVDSRVDKCAGGDSAALLQQGDEDVGRLDGVAVELGGDAGGQLEDLGAARREDHLAALLLGAGPDAPADGLGRLVDVDRLGGEGSAYLGVAERDDAEVDVLGADVVVLQFGGDARRARQQQLARLAQVVDHRVSFPPSVD